MAQRKAKAMMLLLVTAVSAATAEVRMDPVLADVAGGLMYLPEEMEAEPQNTQVQDVVEWRKARHFLVGAASGLLVDLAAREVGRRELVPKLAKAVRRKSLALRSRVSRRPEAEPEVRHSPAWLAAATGLFLFSAMAVKAQRIRRGQGAQPAKAPGTPVARPKAKPPGPPPRGMKGMPKASPRAKANTLDEGMLSPRSAEFARFGKRIHWVKPSCEPQEDTIFGELGSKSEDATPKLQFDKDLMDAMFTPRSLCAMTPRRSWSGPKPQGLALLDNSRAHNIAIVLTKLAISTEELSRCVRTFDTGQQRLKADHVELLHVAMPTASEVTKLQENKHKEELLRDVERRMMPLCSLSPARIKVMKFALTYQSTREALAQRCKVLRDAADESRNSPQFRDLLAIILEAGNYINGEPGVQQHQQERVRAFSIESLQSLANFKVGCISCMHFLCITMRASDTRFLSCLESSLRDVRQAAKEKFSMLRSEVEAFLGEVNFAQARLREMTKTKAKVREAEAEGEVEVEPLWPEVTEEVLARERLSMLVSDFTWKAHQLRLDLARAEQAAVDVQNYFSTSGSPRKDKDTCQASKLQRVPPEQFFGHIAGFLDMVKNSWNEIEGNPGKWRQFMSSADRCKASGTSFARRIQDMDGKDSEGAVSPRKGGSSEMVSPRHSTRKGSESDKAAPCVSPRRLDKDSQGLLSPRRRGSTDDSLPEAPVSPRRLKKDGEGLSSPRRRGSTDDSLPEAPANSDKNGSHVAALIALHNAHQAGASPTREAAPSTPKKVPQKFHFKQRQSPRAGRKSAEEQSMRSFIGSLDGASPAFPMSSQGPHGDRPSVPKLSLQELAQPVCASSSVPFPKDKGEERSASSSTEDGPSGHQGADEGYCSCSSEGFGASEGSPLFSSLGGPLKVPPIKMSGLFGNRGITPSFGPTETKPAQGKNSPRRLLSARSGEDAGARKVSHRSIPRSCEIHQMNDSTDCEYHKLASSDSDSCATVSDEEAEQSK